MGVIEREVGLQMSQVIEFGPSHIIVHMGHNDICQHDYLNPIPRYMTSFVEELHAWTIALQEMFLESYIFVSSLLQRVSSVKFDDVRVKAYNKIALRISQRLNESCREMSVIFVKGLWLRVKTADGRTECFEPHDGLHLNDFGKRLLAANWLSKCWAA